jgi:Leucine-rich repeat (LRR) protein
MRVIQLQTIAPVNGGADCLPIAEPIQLQSCKPCGADSDNCCFVVEMWKLFGYQTDINQDDPYGCCFGDIPGIRCFRNKVISVNWDSRSLSGDFPIHMSRLTYLRSLKLGNNHLKGQIPKSINNLANLEILELQNNNFEGNISLSLPLLSTLKLSNNANLTGTIDISNGMFFENENTNVQKTGTKNSQVQYVCHVQGHEDGTNMDYDSDFL